MQLVKFVPLSFVHIDTSASPSTNVRVLVNTSLHAFQ